MRAGDGYRACVDIVAVTRSGRLCDVRSQKLPAPILSASGSPASRRRHTNRPPWNDGIATRAEARFDYALGRGDRDRRRWASCASHHRHGRLHRPMALVGKDGVVEIKCPNSRELIDCCSATRSTWPTPEQMPVPDGMYWPAQWVDLVSYDNRLPPGMQMYIQRIERDDKIIDKLEVEVDAVPHRSRCHASHLLAASGTCGRRR